MLLKTTSANSNSAIQSSNERVFRIAAANLICIFVIIWVIYLFGLRVT